MVWSLVRPLFFAMPPAAAHSAATMAIAPLEYVAPIRALARALFKPNPRLATFAMGMNFSSPIGLAGGFDKNATRARALAALGFGFVELGTVTALAQKANPAPNLFRLPADRALINRLGFPNQGAETVTARIARRRCGIPSDVPVGVSIGKSRAVDVDNVHDVVADYLASFKVARDVGDFVIVNVSSPNTANLRGLQNADLARQLLSSLVLENAASVKRVPILIKVAPDMADSDIDALLAVVDEVGLDGVVATNTTVSREGLRTPAAIVAAMGAGGLSGPVLKSRALAVVRRARTRLGPRHTIIGVGGVENGEDARHLIGAGANLVQFYTSFVYRGPLAAMRIGRELLEIMDREGVRSVTDMVGVAPS